MPYQPTSLKIGCLHIYTDFCQLIFTNNINSNLYDCYMIQTIFMKNIFIHRIYIDIKFLKSYIENN